MDIYLVAFDNARQQLSLPYVFAPSRL